MLQYPLWQLALFQGAVSQVFLKTKATFCSDSRNLGPLWRQLHLICLRSPLYSEAIFATLIKVVTSQVRMARKLFQGPSPPKEAEWIQRYDLF
jgi:hypothetical protein